MKKILFGLFAAMMIFSACSTAKKDTSVPTTPDTKIPYVIVSQDTYDCDNFSLILAARKMDELGYIHLLGVDITGRDIAGKAGKLFSILLYNTDVPIFINQNQTPTRVTPSSAPYQDIDKYPNDGLLDTQRPDSTEGIADILRRLPTGSKVIYVVGGHLNNISDLIAEYPDIVEEKISKVVIVNGWSDRKSGKPEMNLSENVSRPTGTSAATRNFFKHVPKSVKIVMSYDPAENFPKISTKYITSTKLKYLIENGHYYKHDGMFNIGDFGALLYAATGTSWINNKWADEVNTCLIINNYGAATISTDTKKCNHFYLDNVDVNIEKEAFKNFI